MNHINHDHHLITIAMFLIPTLISIWSLLTTREKLRLDLYNKRFSIYTKALEYSMLFLTGEKQAFQNQNIHTTFTLAIRESQFLFKSESPIYKILRGIQQTCVDIRTFYEEKDEPTFIRREEIVTKQQSIEQQLTDLENAMKSYLKFHRLTKWF